MRGLHFHHNESLVLHCSFHFPKHARLTIHHRTSCPTATVNKQVKVIVLGFVPCWPFGGYSSEQDPTVDFKKHGIFLRNVWPAIQGNSRRCWWIRRLGHLQTYAPFRFSFSWPKQSKHNFHSLNLKRLEAHLDIDDALLCHFRWRPGTSSQSDVANRWRKSKEWKNKGGWALVRAHHMLGSMWSTGPGICLCELFMCVHKTCSTSLEAYQLDTMYINI